MVTGTAAKQFKPAQDLDGVYRGVMKAVAVYVLISLVIWVIASIISTANRY
jgi:hypothetical protein